MPLGSWWGLLLLFSPENTPTNYFYSAGLNGKLNEVIKVTREWRADSKWWLETGRQMVKSSNKNWCQTKVTWINTIRWSSCRLPHLLLTEMLHSNILAVIETVCLSSTFPISLLCNSQPFSGAWNIFSKHKIQVLNDNILPVWKKGFYTLVTQFIIYQSVLITGFWTRDMQVSHI